MSTPLISSHPLFFILQQILEAACQIPQQYIQNQLFWLSLDLIVGHDTLLQGPILPIYRIDPFFLHLHSQHTVIYLSYIYECNLAQPHCGLKFSVTKQNTIQRWSITSQYTLFVSVLLTASANGPYDRLIVHTQVIQRQYSISESE